MIDHVAVKGNYGDTGLEWRRQKKKEIQRWIQRLQINLLFMLMGSDKTYKEPRFFRMNQKVNSFVTLFV